ncbi:MAG TPA: DUF3098 domain-containing protein [Candidatus Kapabacteria bacterium]|nr:DUF3098 domain-containing protein [Candidatus Kapabacteria bacterium]
MAQAQQQRKTQSNRTQPAKRSAKKVSWSFPLERQNWLILAGGLIIIIIGFALMATAITDDPAKHQQVWNNPLAISVAPVLLLIGFLVVIPYGLFWHKKADEQPAATQE